MEMRDYRVEIFPACFLLLPLKCTSSGLSVVRRWQRTRGVEPRRWHPNVHGLPYGPVAQCAAIVRYGVISPRKLHHLGKLLQLHGTCLMLPTSTTYCRVRYQLKPEGQFLLRPRQSLGHFAMGPAPPLVSSPVTWPDDTCRCSLSLHKSSTAAKRGVCFCRTRVGLLQ